MKSSKTNNIEKSEDDDRRIHARLSEVPTRPGVYLMKGADGKILYVGKSVNLKNRLSSYFQSLNDTDEKTVVLVKKIVDFDTIITSNEKEALILESNLIKKHRPKYNVILKDDKRYPSIRIDIKEPYPRLEIIRKTENDGALYFGPYASAGAVRQTVKLINKIFKLRKCSTKTLKTRSRPCLNHQMGLCLAPCCLPVDKKDYGEMVRQVGLFLNGRTPELIKITKQQMEDAAKNQLFEQAASYRDRMFALEKTVEKQITVTNDFKDRDVIAIAGKNALFIVTLMTVRGGFLLGTRHFEFDNLLPDGTIILEHFIRQYYENAGFVPPEVLISQSVDHLDLIQEMLYEIKGKKVTVHFPQRGKKAALVKLAVQNARKELEEKIRQLGNDKMILQGLQRKLRMESQPNRIECFDNSSISGTSSVAAMVVFEKGRPLKAAYRKFKIKSAITNDDYACMDEILSRRFSKIDDKHPLPDLLLVDGGKGQLNIALKVLDRIGLKDGFSVAGIAKKDELKKEIHDKIYLPGRANPVAFGNQVKLLLLLCRIRDEAHRFAITFHRKTRGKRAIGSALDHIPGVGPKRKTMLLRQFGGINKIRAATVKDLCELPGITRQIAKDIKRALLKSA